MDSAENSLNFVPIRYSKSDARRILAWRNDRQIRANSRNEQERSFDSFFALEFPIRYVTSATTPAFFVVKEGEKIGLFALEKPPIPHYRTYEVSLFLEEKFRHLGWGTQALEEGIRWARRWGAHLLYAKIKRDNLPAIRLFHRCGFYEEEEERERYILPLLALQKPRVIAEIGSNWVSKDEEKSLDQAYTLIRTAKECGCDFVKFQLFRADSLYSKNAGKAEYLTEHASADLPMNELFSRLEIPESFLPKLLNCCKREGIAFFASVFSQEDVERLDRFVSLYKIASYELPHLPLIAQVAQTGKPLLLSTGGASCEEIFRAKNAFTEGRGGELTLMHCTAQYPADPLAMNLPALMQLQNSFSCPVGLSDHSQDPVVAPSIAVAYGATIIEKHFTLSRKAEGPDHFFALEPAEMRQLVAAVDLAHKMASHAHKAPLPQEQPLMHFAKRALQATREIAAGERLIWKENFDILRPGNNVRGISPHQLPQIQERRVRKNIPAGAGICKEDLE